MRALQHRAKWRVKEEPVRVGQLVILRNDNLPLTKWALGRVVQCFEGQDGLVRAVKVRTATTVLERPIAKLGLLPVVHKV